MTSQFKRFLSFIIVLSLILSYIPTNIVFASAGFGLKLIEENEAGNGKRNVKLDWDEVSFKDVNTQYYVARKNLETGQWELRGNYASEKVRVLNIYPDLSGSTGLKTWMEDLSSQEETVNISVNQVSISSFNSNPTKYLVKNADGTYNYDVVVFGFWDSFNGKDISTAGSNAIQSFIDAGHGVIFGHDTIQHSGRMANFSKLIPKNISIQVGSQVKTNWIYSEKIRVKKQGSLTTYPFDITGQDLTIPLSHTVNQIPTNPDSVFMSFVKNYYPQTGDGPYFNYNVNGGAKNDVKVSYGGKSYDPNAYLISEGNVSFIQCGHSSGKTNKAEQMVLANLIYAMSQITLSSASVDQMLDMQSPTDMAYSNVNDIELSFSANDTGSNYKYRIIATPLGYSVKSELNAIKNALDDENASGYGSNVKFSQSKSSSVKGGLKEFNYYVDKKSTGVAGDGNDISLATGETLKIPTPQEGLTNDQYLHIAPIDKAGNLGETINVNLWDVLPSKDVTIKYLDKLGDEIVESQTFNAKIGTTVSGYLKDIDNYIYTKTLPDTNIVVSSDDNKNVLEHYYDTYISKDVYRVEHLTYPEEKEVITKDNLNVSYAYGSKLKLNVPTFDDYSFKGYYTIGSKDDEGTNRVDVTGNVADVTWLDNTPIYIHYDKKAVSGTVKVVRSDNKEVIGTYTKKGHINDLLVFTGDEIKENVNITDLDCYTNPLALGYAQSVTLTSNESDNVATIELIPRKKQVVYYGVDYTDVKRARVALGVVSYTYDGVNKTLPVELKEFDGWTLSQSYDGLKMDFTKTNSVVNVEYYKGNPPNMSYDYKVNYYDILNQSTPLDSIKYDSQLLTTPAEIDIKQEKSVNVEGAHHLVDYEVSYMVVTDPDGIKTTLENVEDYGSVLPTPNDNNGKSGSYTVDIYYEPIVLIDYQEYLIQDNEEVLNNEVLFNVDYSETDPYKFSTTKPLDEYEIEKVVVNGEELPNPHDYDFTVVPNNYDEEVAVYYKKIPTITKDVYRVEHLSYPTEKEVLTKDKVSISGLYGTATSYAIPSYSKFDFKGYYTIGSPAIGELNKFDIDGNTATIEWLDDVPLYLHYAKKEVKGTVKIVDANSKEVLGAYSKNGHVDDLLVFTSDEIKNNILISDLACYSNSSILSYEQSVTLDLDEAKNEIILELTPRVKQVVYYGIDYNDQTRAKQVLATEKFTYNGTDTTLPVEIKAFDGWTVSGDYTGLSMDFSKANAVVNVAYYKGNPPQISFNYEVNYYDILNSTPIETLTYPDQLLTVPADIDLKNHSQVQVDSANRKVDFDVSYMEITDPDGIKTKVEDVEHFDDYIPSYVGNDNGKAGKYVVDIYYKPIVLVNYKEYTLNDNNEKVLTNEINFNCLYDKENTQKFAPTKPLSEYTIEEIVIDGKKVDDIENYDFSILADNYNKNVEITYKPIPYIEKQVYRVEHLAYPTEKTIVTKDSTSLSYLYGTTQKFKIPVFSNYNFKNYYTLGSADDNGTNRVDVTGSETTIGFDDNTPIYIHYDKKVVNGTVNILRNDNKQVLGAYSKKGHVGDLLTFSGTELKDNTSISDLDCYSNSNIVGYTVNVPLTLNESENVVDVSLNPSAKQVVYYGVDYNDQTKARVLLGTENYTYDGINKTLPVEIKDFDGWTLSKSYDGLVMDFSKTNGVVSIEYYKGNPPDKSLDFDVNYWDVLNDTTPIKTVSHPTQLLSDPAEIDLIEHSKVQVDNAGRLVDFDISYMVITDPDGVKTTLNNVEEYSSYLPAPNDFNGKAGSYTVDIYYRPIVLANYKEYTIEDNQKVLTDEINFNMVYNKETKNQFAPTKSLSDYTVEEVIIDGVIQNNPQNFDFALLADNYNKTVEVTYKPLTYNLIVEANSKGVKRSYTLYKYTGVLLKEETVIDIPEFKGYSYTSMEVSDDTPSEYLIDNKFKPTVTGTYKVVINYDQLSTITTHYKLIDGTDLVEPKTQNGVIGQDVTIKVPSEVPEEYELAYGYMDSVKYENIANGGEYNFTLQSPVHTANLYYKKNAKYKLNVTSGEGGDAYGEGEYFAGQEVGVMAWATEGYIFDKWTVEGDSSFEISSPNGYTFNFIMPTYDITLKANFIVDPNYVDPDVTEPETPEEPEAPEEPVIPDVPTDNGNSNSGGGNTITKKPIITTPKVETEEVDKTQNDDKSKDKLYKAYIQGYTDNTVRPDENLKRQEVVQVIYNLFGDSSQNVDTKILSKFSDVDENDWYAEALAFCVSNNVITGYTDGTFNPEGDITREELAVVLAKFLDENVQADDYVFTDVNDGWAVESISRLHSKGIVKGYNDGTFKPRNLTNRAEFVSLVNRLIERPITYNEDKVYKDLPKDHWAYDDLMNASNGGIY